MSKAVRSELLSDERLSAQARLLGVLLSDYPDGLEPATAVRILALPRSTVHRWAEELKVRAWLETEGHTKAGRWRLISLIDETPLVPPVGQTRLTSETNETAISPTSGTSASARARGIRSDLPSGSLESSKTNNKIHSVTFGESEGENFAGAHQKVLEKKTSEKKRPTKRWPIGMEATGHMREIARERGINFELEFSKLRDHEFAKGHTDWEAVGRNWMRNARPERNGYSKPPGLVSYEEFHRPASKRAEAVLERVKADVARRARDGAGGGR